MRLRSFVRLDKVGVSHTHLQLRLQMTQTNKLMFQPETHRCILLFYIQGCYKPSKFTIEKGHSKLDAAILAKARLKTAYLNRATVLSTPKEPC